MDLPPTRLVMIWAVGATLMMVPRYPIQLVGIVAIVGSLIAIVVDIIRSHWRYHGWRYRRQSPTPPGFVPGFPDPENESIRCRCVLYFVPDHDHDWEVGDWQTGGLEFLERGTGLRCVTRRKVCRVDGCGEIDRETKRIPLAAYIRLCRQTVTGPPPFRPDILEIRQRPPWSVYP